MGDYEIDGPVGAGPTYDGEGYGGDPYGVDPFADDFGDQLAGLMHGVIEERLGQVGPVEQPPVYGEPFEPAEHPFGLPESQWSPGALEHQVAAVHAELERLEVPGEARADVFQHAAQLAQTWFADPTWEQQFVELVDQHGGDAELALEEIAALAFEVAATEHRARNAGTYDDVIKLYSLAGAPERRQRPQFTTYDQVAEWWDDQVRSGPQAVL